MNFRKFSVKIYFAHAKRCYTKIQPENIKKKSYTDTIFLPKTKFQDFHKNITERDRFIEKEAKFPGYYEWQRKYVNGKEFFLHDGPPYANGEPHMGHAINKILKDIILRSQLIQGSKVHFVPGWDCHGLPIELIAIKDVQAKLTPIEIRKKSRKFAYSKVEIQKQAFKKWGVIGDWDEQCYYTCSLEYIVNQLQMFRKLYEKGLIYHALKPVFWSPSSHTALAEAELVYKSDHVSPAVTVRFKVETESLSEPVYLLIWTTTPWTLPVNRAVCFSRNLEYMLVKIASLPGTYIIAKNVIEENKKKLNKEITILRTVSQDELKNMKYKHPWQKNDICSVFESPNVKLIATGLLHCAPAHGHEDFLMGIKHGLSMDCFVDENGCYTKEIGDDLNGLEVLTDGSNYVIKKLDHDIIFKESYVHNYPYDWRTNKPIIIRSSNQWFIDTETLKSKAIACLSDVSVPISNFKQKLETRPYWCLSRQRVWGVPIPAFIHKSSRKRLLSGELIQHLCEVYKKFGVDSWWSQDVKVLFPEHFCKQFNVGIGDVEKGNDIMDIWFDSGISWSFVLDSNKSDVCVEGADQFGGWFQSSLLTSVADRGSAPYKHLLIHGYAVDEKGKKMSKSIGNVYDPMNVVEGDKALGVDVLRWWVASHSHHTTVPVSDRLLQEDGNEIIRIKRIVKFLLGSLNGIYSSDVKNISPTYQLDRYLLNICYEIYYSVMSAYNNYNVHSVCSQLLHFLSNEVSNFYIGSVKDRLYCDEMNAERRLSCVFTFSGILDTLCHCIAPILPHLAEEIHLHHPFRMTKQFFYNQQMWIPPASWKDDSSAAAILLAREIKREIDSISRKSQEFSCLIEVEEADYNLLKKLQGNMERSTDSELTELLQVAAAELKLGKRKFSLSKVSILQCPRCRRFTAENEELCFRCRDAIAKRVRLKKSI